VVVGTLSQLRQTVDEESCAGETPTTILPHWPVVFAKHKPIYTQHSTVGIAAGYRLDDRGVGVRVPVGSRIFSSQCRPDGSGLWWW
jgi:hypothetical protein